MAEQALTILLVEDNPGDARLLRESLGGVGEGRFVVTEARTVKDALRRIAEPGAYDIILLDLTLPDSSGLDTLRRVHQAAPTMPIAVLTGISDEQLGLEAIRAGAQDYLIKGQVDGRVVARAIRYATERKRLEEDRASLEAQMRQAQKLESLGVLAGGIAHDFNNLLTAILGNAELAMGDLPPGSGARNSIIDIEHASRRAADLCRQMLAYSGRGRLVIEPVNLNGIVQEMARLLRVSVSRKASFEFKLTADLPYIEADATQIQQIVMNLITNASEAVGDQVGLVSISTWTQECDRACLNDTFLGGDIPVGLYVCLEVTDTGCGMDEETMSRIFDPFFTTKFTGRGLGLAAVMGIVRGHHGTIRVRTEPGKGTAFQVYFPVMANAPLADESRPLDGREWRSSGAILLVDDEEVVRSVESRRLEKMGFTVLTAADGVEAIDVFRAHADEIRVVILDLTMPRMGGAEAFQELRKIRPDVRVILSSGYGEQELKQRFEHDGFAGVLQKPYRMSALVAKLQEALGEQG